MQASEERREESHMERGSVGPTSPTKAASAGPLPATATRTRTVGVPSTRTKTRPPGGGAAVRLQADGDPLRTQEADHCHLLGCARGGGHFTAGRAGAALPIHVDRPRPPRTPERLHAAAVAIRPITREYERTWQESWRPPVRFPVRLGALHARPAPWPTQPLCEAGVMRAAATERHVTCAVGDAQLL